jgi:HEPN domain-containing protein
VRSLVHNELLSQDYLRRAAARLKALRVFLEEESWADAVREAQEAVELTLKALLRGVHIEVPRVHDVSPILDQYRERMPASVRPRLDELMEISRRLRRDRELAFYGSEDLTPSEFYTAKDAAEAVAQAGRVYEVVRAALPEPR